MSDKLVRTSTAIKSEGDFAEKLSETRSSIVQRPQVDSGLVGSFEINKRRSWSMNFGPVEVPSGETVTVSATTRCYFRGNKIINTGEVDGLYVLNIFVGQRPQFPQSMFQPVEFQMDVATPAQNITFVVANASSKPRMWAMSLIGEVVS
jgi:hypothetical protein